MDSYVYDSLDHASDEIRLATLVSIHDQIVRIRLESFSMSTAPDFIALYYVWGGAEEPMEIMVNSTAFHIHQNLRHGIVAIWGSKNKLHRWSNRNWCRNRQSCPTLHVTI